MKIDVRELNINAPVNNRVLQKAVNKQDSSHPDSNHKDDTAEVAVYNDNYMLSLPDNLLIEQVLDWKRW